MSNTAIHRVIDLAEQLLAQQPKAPDAPREAAAQADMAAGAAAPGVGGGDATPVAAAAAPLVTASKRDFDLLVILASLLLLPMGVLLEAVIDLFTGFNQISLFTRIAVLLAEALIILEVAFAASGLFLLFRNVDGHRIGRHRRTFFRIFAVQAVACLLCCVLYLEDGYSVQQLTDLGARGQEEAVAKELVALFATMLALCAIILFKLRRKDA